MDFKNLNIPLVGYGLFITLFHISEYNREVACIITTCSIWKCDMHIGRIRGIRSSKNYYDYIMHTMVIVFFLGVLTRENVPYYLVVAGFFLKVWRSPRLVSAENRHIFRGNVLLGHLRNGGIVSSHKRMKSLLFFCLVTVNTNEYILNITILSFHGIWKEYLFVEYKFTGKRAHMYKARAKVYNVYHVQIHITFLTFTEPNMSASLVFWEVQFPFLF